MERYPTVKKLIALTSALILIFGIIYGCNYKDPRLEEGSIYGQDYKAPQITAKDMDDFRSSIRKVDGEAEGHYQLALHFQSNYRHKIAIDELLKVLKRNPAHVKAHNAMGVSYDNIGEHEKAAAYYKLALRVDPKLDYIFNNLGYSYLLQGHNSEAADAFRSAIALNGKEKRYRNNLGLVHVKLDQYDLALEQFRASETEANAVAKLAKVMRDLGKKGDAAMIAKQFGPQLEAETVAHAANPAPVQGATGEALADSAALPENETEYVESPNAASIEMAALMNRSSRIEPEPFEDTEEPELLAAKKEKHPPKPVIDITPAPETPTQAPQMVELASISPSLGGLEVADLEEPSDSAVPHYHVASIGVVQDPVAERKAASPQKTIGTTAAQPISKELRQVLPPPRINLMTAAEQEVHEERILVASASTKAAGWQNAPQPRQTLEKSIIEVEVQNGNGVKHSATKVAAHLRKNGFNVVRVDDAQSQDHFSTKVFYCSGSMQEVTRMLQTMPEIVNEAELYEVEGSSKYVRLLVGKDLVDKNTTLSWAGPKAKRQMF
jgi:Tfp pilus assembly protein PilF